jgi:hypothetical protein
MFEYIFTGFVFGLLWTFFQIFGLVAMLCDLLLLALILGWATDKKEPWRVRGLYFARAVVFVVVFVGVFFFFYHDWLGTESYSFLTALQLTNISMCMMAGILFSVFLPDPTKYAAS